MSRILTYVKGDVLSRTVYVALLLINNIVYIFKLLAHKQESGITVNKVDEKLMVSNLSKIGTGIKIKNAMTIELQVSI